MTKTDKLVARFKKAKNDFTWNELADWYLEIAKIESIKAVQVAKIDSEAKKDIAQKTAISTLEVTKLDTQTKEHQTMITLQISNMMIMET